MPALTRAEATERAHRIRVHRAFVDLDLRDPAAFLSTTTIEFAAARLPGPTFIDIRPRRLLRAALNDEPIDPGLLIEGRLPIHPAPDNVLTLSGEMAYSNDGEGLHRHVDPADNRAYLYAMSFLDAAPRWFACFDQPDLKCPYAMRVLTPKGWTVLGNGRFTQIAPGEWAMTETPPLAPYFVTLVAGPYASTFDSHEGIRLGLHARASLAGELAHEADDIVRVTKQGLTAFGKLYGEPYAFGDYHQAFVPDFNAGAMENPGCVTFRDSFLFRGQVTRSQRAHRAGTIVHELAHQWFGNLVTMRWWDDLWLNESFAEYAGHQVCEDHTDYSPWRDFGLNRKDWGAIADQGPTTHPVAGNGAEDAEAALAQFDGISYAKGAGVLKQLVAHVTPEVFRAGVQDYMAQHRFGVAEFADLREALEHSWRRANPGADEGVEDLARWSEAWLLTSGMDTLTARSGTGLAHIVRTPGSVAVPREHTVRLAALAADATEVERWKLTVPANETASPGPAESAGAYAPVAGGLLIPDAADETWARIRPDQPVERWPPLSAVSDPLTRVVLWNSVRDQVRSAELDPVIALDLVCSQLPDESDDLIAQAVFDWGQTVLCGTYSPAADRQARLCRLADTASHILAGADPGTDLQLSAWRALLGCTDDEASLRGWLAGTDLPRSRRLDPELRWRTAIRLAAITGDRDVIDAAYAHDRSAAGRVYRARARAALPDPAAKAEAFDTLMRPGHLSAYELYAIADCFFLPEQAEITQPFVSRFFDEVNATAAFRRGWALGQIVLRAFPAAANSRTTLDLAERLLTSGDLAPGVRQPLLEATDALRRAVVSIEKFGRRTRSHPQRAACY